MKCATQQKHNACRNAWLKKIIPPNFKKHPA